MKSKPTLISRHFVLILISLFLLSIPFPALFAGKYDEPCPDCEEWDDYSHGCIPVAVTWTTNLLQCPEFIVSNPPPNIAYCADPPASNSIQSMSVAAPPLIQARPGKYERVPDPSECGDRTEHEFSFDSTTWIWEAEFTGDGDIDPSSGTGETAAFNINFGNDPGSWSVSVTFTATGTNKIFSCTHQAQGVVTIGSVVAKLSVEPFLGLQIKKDIFKGVKVDPQGPDTGTATISGIPGTIIKTDWTLNGSCVFDPPAPAADTSATIKEMGVPSSSYLSEGVTVQATFEVSTPDGTSTETCTKTTNFTVVAVNVDMPLVLCGQTNEDAAAPFTIDFETKGLPSDHKISLYGELSGHWYEDAGKTIPAKSEYPVTRLPMTLYHNLYIAPQGQTSGTAQSVPIGTHSLKASHYVKSRAEYEVTYDIISAEIIAELPRSGPEVPPELRNDPMALLIPIPKLEKGADPSQHQDRATLKFKTHYLPKKGFLTLNYAADKLTLYDDAGLKIATGTSVDLEAPGGPLAPLASGDLILYAVGKAPAYGTAISIDYSNDNDTCTLAKHLATVFKLEWYIDAKNQHGSHIPPQDPDVDAEAEPGKFVPVNRSDEDSDAIPDYADIEVPGQKALIPTLLVIEPADLDWERLNVRVSFAGDEETPDLGALHPTDILYKSQPSGFTNYLVTISNALPLRLWSIDEASDSRDTERYVVPDKIQTVFELKEGFDGQTPLWLEGLKEIKDLLKFDVTAITEIDKEHVLTDKKVRASVFEAKLGLNTSNDNQDDKLRPGIPDVEFKINDYDEMIKDQVDGFQWWWGRDEPNIGMGFFTYSSIVDLFPMMVRIPQELLDNGFEPHMSIEGSLNKLFIYSVVNQPVEDRLAHLKDPARGERQLAASPGAFHISTAPYPIDVPRGDETVEFLAKPWGSGVEQAKLILWLKDPGGNFIPVDSWRTTFKDTEEFWALYSARNKVSGKLGYRVEDDRVVSSEFYNLDSQPIGGVRDPEKTKYLVMVHGFNVTIDEARLRFNEIWRRLFWLGFRGQFIGITWQGDVGLWNSGILPIVTFDSSVQNALQTSTALMLFLHKEVRNWAGGVQNVDVFAHSLGNLVVWDAMRLYQMTGTGAGNPLFRNLISVEAAVWPETFDPEGPVVYGAEQNPANNITYSMDDLKEHSWKSWFNQSAHPASASLGGQVYHSFVPDDIALFKGMRLNDDMERGSYASGGSYHYYRSKLQRYPPNPPKWRAPKGEKQSNVGWGVGQQGNNVQNRLHDIIPTLMLQGHREPYYTYEDLNLPVGAMQHPFNHNVDKNATDPDLGWREKKHSDFAVGESGDADAKMWLPVIWNWFEQFIQPAICINEE